MRIEINGIEREVLIAQAPQSSFVIQEGLMSPIYPAFVAFCQPIGDEKKYGNILVCPITDFNGGYASCGIDELCTEFEPKHLKSCISGWMDNYEVTLRDAVDYITTDINNHDVFVTEACCDVINKIENGEITSLDELC